MTPATVPTSTIFRKPMPQEEFTVRLGSSISASLLYGLSWILLGVATLMVVLALGAFLGFLALPKPVRADLVGAAICFVLGLGSRFMARRFEQLAYLS